ncbi:FCSD flavin-binding domain-containing protein [Azospira restricta]|uniref:FCSD flavin-binding domain-containing protein n=1 Tax=Azospira restricta TaxID=404405 RepID=A0A974SN02_9RHOO|nr:FCSD flavin-binding domain-containing protein [Azospira restricta]QRJ63506.1 FCSD flavin-binding domain-containing protein [Azospira restricta]
MFDRRDFLKAAGASAGLVALGGCAGAGSKPGGHVVVVGGGYGGATAAKYLRMWSNGSVEVTLVERNREFISCPISNLVVAGERTLADVTVSYEGLKKWGVRVIHDDVVGIDAEKRRIRLATYGELAYDRAVLSPGIEFMWDQVPGLNNADAQAKILHAWKAGPQTVALRKQLEAMKDGGVYALTVPKAPYRCPPGPYERASVIAHYLKTHKPKSKVLVLDANEDVVSKKGLFVKAWQELYPGIVEYRPNSELRDVDVANRTAILEFDKVKADVLNVVPPHRAGDLVAKSGAKLANGRWAEVDWRSMESENVKGIHILGDSTLSAPLMPKSGFMANQHGKVAAAAILNLLAGEAPNPEPMMANTCYSFVDAKNVIHVASVHKYDAEKRTMLVVPGASGVSAARNELEGSYAIGWAKNIWADMLA